jgi:hypothetical protein
MIPSAGAGDVQQMPFGLINFLQIGVVTHVLDALLQRDVRKAAANAGRVSGLSGPSRAQRWC